MKRRNVLGLGALVALLISCSIVKAVTLETHSVAYQTVRSEIATADHDPNTVERTYAYFEEHYDDLLWVPTRDRLYTTSQSRPVVHANYVQLAFTFNDASATATVTVYAMRDPASAAISPLEPVCSYNLVAGAQVADDGRYFADTATETTDQWDVKPIDGDGNNGVAKIEFDMRGYYGVLVLFTTLSGADNVSCHAAYY